MDVIQNQFLQIWNKKWLQIQHRAPTEYRYHVFILILKSDQHQGELTIINNILLLTLSGIFYA